MVSFPRLLAYVAGAWLLLTLLVSSCETPSTPKELPSPRGPRITSINPTLIRNNQDLSKNQSFIIKGHNLTGTQTVMFSSGSSKSFQAVAGQDFDVTDSTTITFQHLPVGAPTGVVSVSVTNPVGTANNSAISLTVLGEGPTVIGFQPTVVQVGDVLTITGANLVGLSPSQAATEIYLDSLGRSASILAPRVQPSTDTDNQLRVTIPPGAITGKVWIKNFDKTVASTQVLLIRPKIVSITPCGNAGSSDELEIRGYNFLNNPNPTVFIPNPPLPTSTQILFNGTIALTPSASFTMTNRVIRVSMPSAGTAGLIPGLNTGSIQVTTQSGSHTSSNNFVLANTPAARDSAVCGSRSIQLIARGGVPGGYRWYTQPTGGTPDSQQKDATFTVPAQPPGQVVYYVAVSNCAGESARKQVTATFNTQSTAGFNYPNSSYCKSGTNPTPNVTGTTGGTFSSSTGLSLNATTGAINLSTSTPGTYTVTYAVGGTCPSSSTQTVTINAAPTAGFSYGSASYCVSGPTNPTVTLATGATAGTFSSAAGLTLNATTGAITLASSTPGTYTVTNTIVAANGCAQVTATASVTITNSPTAGFSYPTATTCAGTAATLTPTLSTGATSGTFSASPAAGLTLNATTGAITLVSSAAGTYTVTNTVAAANGCAAATATASVTLYPKPTANAGSNQTICSGSSATIGTAAVTGNTYSWSPATGLSNPNAAQPTVTLTNATAAAIAQTYTLTVTGQGSCQSTDQVTVTVTPSVAFSQTTYSYVKLTTTPNPVLGLINRTNANGGTFNAVPRVQGNNLHLNPNSGEINISQSDTGIYDVSFTETDACGATITVTAVVTIM